MLSCSLDHDVLLSPYFVWCIQGLRLIDLGLYLYFLNLHYLMEDIPTLPYVSCLFLFSIHTPLLRNRWTHWTRTDTGGEKLLTIQASTNPVTYKRHMQTKYNIAIMAQILYE